MDRSGRIRVGFLPAALPDRKKAAKTKDVHTRAKLRVIRILPDLYPVRNRLIKKLHF
ncbi:hypothetical protein PANT111_250044 [Pantoea brenneri]|uniref:Uncharacterized protein n=1 Tax=Pantoea brenneri TaxID=472694 RepID=A0AAX3J8X0_9GAMM|nr:hypothetical protein PANT111_250044 [Pantoea brenneri]